MVLFTCSRISSTPVSYTHLDVYKRQENYHTRITTSSLKLKAVSAYGDISEHLNVSDDTPLLYSTGLTYGIKNDEEIPIELFYNYYLTTRFEYSLIQRR